MRTYRNIGELPSGTNGTFMIAQSFCRITFCTGRAFSHARCAGIVPSLHYTMNNNLCVRKYEDCITRHLGHPVWYTAAIMLLADPSAHGKQTELSVVSEWWDRSSWTWQTAYQIKLLNLVYMILDHKLYTHSDFATKYCASDAFE